MKVGIPNFQILAPPLLEIVTTYAVHCVCVGGGWGGGIRQRPLKIEVIVDLKNDHYKCHF